MKGILIIRGGAIGDFICTMPVVAALRQALPGTPLSLLSYDRVLPLAGATGSFMHLRSIESQAFAGFFASRSQLNEEWVEFFGSFGMILSFLYDPDEILAENLKRCRVKTVLTLDPRPVDRHVSEHLCSILNLIAIFPENFSPTLALQNIAAPTTSAGDVVLHAGSGSEKKNWSIDNWRKILKLLVSRGVPVTVIEGEADVERTSQLLSGMSSPQVSVMRNKSLLEIASVLCRARIFVGHDSGITHLAAALGTTTLALFGPTHPHLWAPRGEKTKILWKNKVWEPETSSPLQLEEISVDDNSLELVKAEVERMLDKNSEPRTQSSE